MSYTQWSDVRREIDSMSCLLQRKAEQHELVALRHDLDRVECTLQAISTSLDGVRAWMQEVQESRKGMNI